jgi:xylulokinase
VILTLDFGTSVIKAALWAADGLVALEGVAVETSHVAPERAEQDPGAWWSALREACAALRSVEPRAFATIEVVGCTGARQTLVMADAGGRALGPAIVWSDRRAGTEAEQLRRRLESSGPTLPDSGIEVDAASVAAKLAWLATYERDRLAAASWILAPRDYLVWTMTGVVATDPTMAWRSGLYDLDGRPRPELVGRSGRLLPPLVAPDQVVGGLTVGSARSLGMRSGTPVVIGCGDRASEVLGSGATVTSPMVSWGTTANVSVPLDAATDAATSVPRVPAGVVLTRGATGGWLLEGGISAAGSLLAWLSTVTGRTERALAEMAATSPPGARGVVAAPWLEGARAPWWREDAAAALVGLGPSHTAADLARAAFESVAWDVLRCLDVMEASDEAAASVGLMSTGGGSGIPVWLEVLSAVTGRPVEVRSSGQAASTGAALLAARAIGREFDLADLDPVVARTVPDAVTTATYRNLRDHVDSVAGTLVDLGTFPASTPCT